MTVRVIEHSACCSTWSVAEKVTTYCPTWERSGVQENTLLTGLPVVGSGGVMVAPAGRPATFSVTTSPASGSDAVTVVLAGTPAGRVSSECAGRLREHGRIVHLGNQLDEEVDGDPALERVGHRVPLLDDHLGGVQRVVVHRAERGAGRCSR